MSTAKTARAETKVAGVRLSNPDKILYPDQGITKAELADYYLAVADHMLPHVRRRPVTLLRCPTGQEQKCFYQRHAGSGVPDELKQVKVPGFEEPFLYIEDAAGLVALVQMGVLEIHPWGVTVDRPTSPDRLIFDLDPGEGLGFNDVVGAALDVRAHLEGIGLASFVKATGGKGLHVVVPIAPTGGWGEAKAFAKALSEAMAAEAPDRFLTRSVKAERVGRIFIDYLRNDPTSTAVGPYSTRARAGAPVAMPLDWKQVKSGLDPCAFTVETVPGLLKRRRKDPWADMLKIDQPLPGSL
jgi:bifunctional non-homologous end joining protein LigD